MRQKEERTTYAAELSRTEVPFMTLHDSRGHRLFRLFSNTKKVDDPASGLIGSFVQLSQ